MTLQLPMVLALIGTALMAVVIFAPRRATVDTVVSFAPPPAAVQPWAPSAPCAPAWPALFDERASDCDAVARLALVDALAAVRAPWSDAILLRALDDETDAGVRSALRQAQGRLSTGKLGDYRP